MRKYKHLSLNDRFKIEMALLLDTPVKEIAEKLGVHECTIYRERKKATYVHTIDKGATMIEEVRYCPERAHSLYKENASKRGKQLKIGSDHELASFIEDRIMHDKYSPEAVIGLLRACDGKFSVTIKSKSTIYSYIDKGVFLNLTNEHLPVRCNKKRKYNKVRVQKRATQGDSIEVRPEHINDREEIGHWEMDTVKGKITSKKCMLVLTERKTRVELIELMKDCTANSVRTALNRVERRFGKDFTKVFKTITVDNGMEFSDHDSLEKSCISKGKKRIELYYCRPYHSWERGSNEVNNKLIRRHYPKGTCFSSLTTKAVKLVETWMNSYPRRSFDYMTSGELFKDELDLLEVHITL